MATARKRKVVNASTSEPGQVRVERLRDELVLALHLAPAPIAHLVRVAASIFEILQQLVPTPPLGDGAHRFENCMLGCTLIGENAIEASLIELGFSHTPSEDYPVLAGRVYCTREGDVLAYRRFGIANSFAMYVFLVPNADYHYPSRHYPNRRPEDPK